MDALLRELLVPENVVFLHENDRESAMKSIVDHLYGHGNVDNNEEFLTALKKREQIASTGIGLGVALPHARLATMDHFCLGIGVKHEGAGIFWDSLDGSTVRLVFLIGGPEDRQKEYLTLLSSLTTVIKDEECRKEMSAAQTSEEVIEVLLKRQP